MGSSGPGRGIGLAGRISPGSIIDGGASPSGPDGRARIVDVNTKPVITRHVVAQGRFRTTTEVIELIRRDGLAMVDSLAMACIAGLVAATRTANLIPLRRPIARRTVTIDLELGQADVLITAPTATADPTRVEMEALTALAVAGLAHCDIVKAIDRAPGLTDVGLTHKTRGRTGDCSLR